MRISKCAHARRELWALLLAFPVLSGGACDEAERSTEGVLFAQTGVGPVQRVDADGGERAIAAGVGGSFVTVGAGAADGAGGDLTCIGFETGNCYSCCQELFPDGVAPFESDFLVCGCLECALECGGSLCAGLGAPTPACELCAIRSIEPLGVTLPAGVCADSTLFQNQCLSNVTCNDFVNCLRGC